MGTHNQISALYVWDADYPWDIRTAKVCQALTDGGIRVTIAARDRKDRAPLEELAEGTVVRLGRPGFLGGALGDAATFPAFVNPRWTWHLRRIVRTHRPDIIIVRDLPLALTALKVARRSRLPVVLDMAENYPAMIQDIWTSGRQRWWDVFVRNPALVRMVERSVVARINAIITVVEESSRRLETMGVAAARLTVVSNTPSREAAVAQVRAPRAGLSLVYLGLLEFPRGVDDLLRAVALVGNRIPGLRLRIIGGGRDEQALRAVAAELGLGPPAVEFTGYLPNAEALALVAEADVGVVPHRATESWNTTIPNKLFDYMAAGLAVLSSDAGPAARVVNESGAGLIFASGDADSCAAALLRLADPELRHKMAVAGRDAVAARYNWEHDSEALLTLVRNLANGGHQHVD